VHFYKLTPNKNYYTCSQESHLSFWQPFLFVRVVNIHKTHAVLYCQFYETLNHTKFSKNVVNEGKLQVSSCRCLLRQNDPRDEYLGVHLPANCANPTIACSRSDNAPAFFNLMISVCYAHFPFPFLPLLPSMATCRWVSFVCWLATSYIVVYVHCTLYRQCYKLYISS